MYEFVGRRPGSIHFGPIVGVWALHTLVPRSGLERKTVSSRDPQNSVYRAKTYLSLEHKEVS